MNTKSTDPTDSSDTHSQQDNNVRGRTPPSEFFGSMSIQLASHKAADILREERRRGRLTLIGLSSAVAIILIALGGFLVNELLDVRVSKRVQSTIHEELSDVNFKMDLIVFRADYEEAFKNVGIEGVSESSLESAFAEAERLVETYVMEPDLPVHESSERERAILPDLEKIIDIAASVDRSDLVNDFYNLSPKLLEKIDVMIQTLVQHFGRQLIGRAGAPRVWYDRVRAHASTEEYLRYSRLAERARDTGYPEMFLAFELIVRHVDERPRDEIVELIRDAETLNIVDKANFVRLMVAHASGGFVASMELDAADERLVKHYTEFIVQYQNESDLIMQIGEIISEGGNLVPSTRDQQRDAHALLG